jgi:hypothetical protein
MQYQKRKFKNLQKDRKDRGCFHNVYFWSLVRNSVVLAVCLLFSVGFMERQDSVTEDFVTSAGSLIKRLYESGLITPVTGQDKGKYKFTEPQR